MVMKNIFFRSDTFFNARYESNIRLHVSEAPVAPSGQHPLLPAGYTDLKTRMGYFSCSNMKITTSN